MSVGLFIQCTAPMLAMNGVLDAPKCRSQVAISNADPETGTASFQGQFPIHLVSQMTLAIEELITCF